MTEPRKLYVGLDVGGTSVKVGLFLQDGTLVGKGSVPTPPIVDEAGYSAVTNGIGQVLAEADATTAEVLGIGLAIPCPVPADGVIRMQANIQIRYARPRGRAARILPASCGEVRERRERSSDGRILGPARQRGARASCS